MSFQIRHTRLPRAGRRLAKGLAFIGANRQFRRSIIARLAHGFLLLQLRGWEGLSFWFYVKIGFVILLTVSHIMARRTGAEMMRSGNGALLSRVSLFIAGVWVSALAALALAVLAFG